MAVQDKAMLMRNVEETLKPRMFANLLDESLQEINGHLDNYDVKHIGKNDNKEDDFLAAYIKAKSVEGRSQLTLTRYQYIIERFMKYVKVRTRDITTHHIRDYISHELARGISESTAEGTREVINAYFAWLEKENLVCINPAIHVGVIKCQKKVREAFSEADIERLKRNCTSIRDSAIVNFLMSTGCRISEVTALNRSDVDLINMECSVLGKGNKERVVYLNDVAAMTLKEYLASRSDKEEPLFLGCRKERLTPDGVRRILKKLAKRAKVSNVHPHRFRRTLITNLLNRGMPIQEVAIVAGHDKIDTTMRYFASSKGRIKNSFNKYVA